MRRSRRRPKAGGHVAKRIARLIPQDQRDNKHSNFLGFYAGLIAPGYVDESETTSPVTSWAVTGAIQTDVPSRRGDTSFQTRHGDWVMRVRFWSMNTRETNKSVRQRLSARASYPNARSHNPITVPGRFRAVNESAHTHVARRITQSPCLDAFGGNSVVQSGCA